MYRVWYLLAIRYKKIPGMVSVQSFEFNLPTLLSRRIGSVRLGRSGLRLNISPLT